VSEFVARFELTLQVTAVSKSFLSPAQVIDKFQSFLDYYGDQYGELRVGDISAKMAPMTVGELRNVLSEMPKDDTVKLLTPEGLNMLICGREGEVLLTETQEDQKPLYPGEMVITPSGEEGRLTCIEMDDIHEKLKGLVTLNDSCDWFELSELRRISGS